MWYVPFLLLSVFLSVTSPPSYLLFPFFLPSLLPLLQVEHGGIEGKGLESFFEFPSSSLHHLFIICLLPLLPQSSSSSFSVSSSFPLTFTLSPFPSLVYILSTFTFSLFSPPPPLFLSLSPPSSSISMLMLVWFSHRHFLLDKNTSSPLVTNMTDRSLSGAGG